MVRENAVKNIFSLYRDIQILYEVLLMQHTNLFTFPKNFQSSTTTKASSLPIQTLTSHPQMFVCVLHACLSVVSVLNHIQECAQCEVLRHTHYKDPLCAYNLHKVDEAMRSTCLNTVFSYRAMKSSHHSHFTTRLTSQYVALSQNCGVFREAWS